MQVERIEIRINPQFNANSEEFSNATALIQTLQFLGKSYGAEVIVGNMDEALDDYISDEALPIKAQARKKNDTISSKGRPWTAGVMRNFFDELSPGACTLVKTLVTPEEKYWKPSEITEKLGKRYGRSLGFFRECWQENFLDYKKPLNEFMISGSKDYALESSFRRAAWSVIQEDKNHDENEDG